MPFERIDPKAARELFIRHALVHMEYDTRAPFLAHNLKLLEDTEYLQQKGRRVDLLGDEAQLYAFFDARVPEGISTGAAFERWRREAEAKNPKILCLTEQRHRRPAKPSSMPSSFPDHLSAGPLVVQLRYRFEPGHEDDGVSALIPLHVLNQLPEEAFEWLVPGLLDEKIEALVRSLPKNLRVHFVPVPEAVARVLPLLESGCGSLHAQLADALLRTGGVPRAARCVPRGPAAAAPAHELPAARRRGQGDRALAQPRGAARQACRRVAAGLREAVAAHHRRADLGVRRYCRSSRTSPRAAAQQIGYPALVDEGDSVGLRVFATPPEARISHERGSARLIRLVMARDFKSYAARSCRQRAGRDGLSRAGRASAAESGSRRRAATCATTCSIAS